jgi:hypothetical protein
LTVQQPEIKFGEMHKKQCLVGYLILTGTGAILAIKFYLLLFVMELDSRATEKEGELRKGEY